MWSNSLHRIGRAIIQFGVNGKILNIPIKVYNIYIIQLSFLL